MSSAIAGRRPDGGIVLTGEPAGEFTAVLQRIGSARVLLGMEGHPGATTPNR